MNKTLNLPIGPGQDIHGERSIVVDAQARTITIYKDNQVVRIIREFSWGRGAAPSGRNWDTPNGEHFEIYHGPGQRVRRGHMSGAFHVEMPFALFFAPGGVAFHQGNVNVASHGCIHLGPADAPWLFDWVGGYDVSVAVRGAGSINPDHRVPRDQTSRAHAAHR